MFLQVSVCPRGRMSAFESGGCLPLGRRAVSASGSGGGCLQADVPTLLGRHIHPTRQTPPPGRHLSPETATAADGTHPTGTHSCFCCFRLLRTCFLTDLSIENGAKNGTSQGRQFTEDYNVWKFN